MTAIVYKQATSPYLIALCPKRREYEHLGGDTFSCLEVYTLSWLRTYTSFQRKLHQCLVDRYEAKCSGAFSKLDDDKYIFKKLIGHIISAGKYLCQE